LRLQVQVNLKSSANPDSLPSCPTCLQSRRFHVEVALPHRRSASMRSEAWSSPNARAQVTVGIRGRFFGGSRSLSSLSEWVSRSKRLLPNWRSYRKTVCRNARIGRKSLRVGPSVLMSGSLSSSAYGRASPDALVAAACHYRTVNLPILVIEPADLVPVLVFGLVIRAL
jgi:hypothetical protein